MASDRTPEPGGRRLVLTADDLGREPESAREIARLAADGTITAATVIVVAPGWEAAAHAVARAGIRPHLHATLSSERGLPPWAPVTDGASLVDAHGRLPDDPAAVGERAEPGEVAAELAAQLARLDDAGLPPLALDSHAGTLYGLSGRSFLGEALALCARRGLAFRLPRDATLYFGGEPPAAIRAAHERAVAAADAAGVPIPASIATNRSPAAALGSYEALRDAYLGILAALPEGTSEVFLHPAPEGAVAGPDGITRVWELRVLRDPVFRRAIDAEGIRLVPEWAPGDGPRADQF